MKRYEDYVAEMISIMKANKFSRYGRRVRKRCYDAFGEYLADKKVCYSDETVEKWLEEVIKPHNSIQKYHVIRMYISQLQELIRKGTINPDNLLCVKPYYDKLPEMLRKQLDIYLDVEKTSYTEKSLKYAKIHGAHFLLLLADAGVESLEDVCYSALDSVYRKNLGVTRDERFVIISHGRQILYFYHKRGILKRSFSLMLEDSIFPYVSIRESIESEILGEMEKISQSESLCTPDEMYGLIEPFVDTYRKNRYSYTIIKTVTHTLKCLYVFLECNGLKYNAKISYIWYETVKGIVGQSHRAWRRVLLMFGRYMAGEENSFSKKYSLTPGRTEKYPDWCRKAVEKYAEWLRRSFHSESTVRTYCYSVYSFCDFLLSKGISSFKDITPELLKEYIAGDHHATFTGKSGRVTVINRFLWFLENFITEKDDGLYLVLMTGISHEVSIPYVLSDDEVRQIYAYRDNSATGVEMRNTAMLMLGLRLGLRASDVLNLKFRDIDWKNRKISIVMEKTKYPITLPLPNDAGNALYRYIKNARPSKEDDLIFISHKAPYGKLTNKICAKAFYAALPELKGNDKASFHALRRTFATGILRNNAGIGAVVDALGHNDNTSVEKYLSFDDEHMSMCPLSLAECGIAPGRSCL